MNEFIQSGKGPSATSLAEKLKQNDPYTLHLMRQPMLLDYIPRYERVEDWHIANFLSAQKIWLHEERDLRKEWR